MPAAGPDPAVPSPATLERMIQVVSSLPGRTEDIRAVLNGLFGDTLAAQGSSLAVPMTLRTSSGEELALECDALVQALPDAGPRLCVFVHGLMSNEAVWRFGGRDTVTYGDLLARDRGVTAVYVRYNTGRHISTNGRELARLLRQLVRVWPVRVREITLVGHSMGGLVIRGACHYGHGGATIGDRLRGRGSWPGRVKRIVLLGVPNTGANLEVIANLTSAALWAVPNPVVRLVGAGLDRRSDGIKDLRWGSVLDEDWIEVDPDATERPPLHPVRRPRHARVLVVAGSLTAGEDTGHVNRMLGDALVTGASAAGRVGEADVTLLPNATIRRCPKVTHIALASRPEVYDEIIEWWHR